MNFTQHFGLTTDPTKLDFVDIDLTKDNLEFIDPWLIKDLESEFGYVCSEYLQTYFDELIDSIRSGNEKRATELLDNLHEVNWTRFGYSAVGMRGKAIASEHAEQIYQALKTSRAVKTGLLKDIEDTALLIPGIGKDKISDIVTNICLPLLVEYTIEQAKLHNIPVQPVGKFMTWNPTDARWQEGDEFQLPVHDGVPILLVPKVITNIEMAINGSDYYYKYVLPFEQERHLNDPTSGLCTILKTTGKRKAPSKQALKKIVPYSNSTIITYVNEQPQLLEQYKKDLGGKKTVKKRKKRKE